MDRKPRKALQAITIGIADRITDRLAEKHAMSQTPDRLAHSSQVLGWRGKSSLLGEQIANKIRSKSQGQQRNQAHCHPERARMRQRFGFRVEIERAPYNSEPLSPG